MNHHTSSYPTASAPSSHPQHSPQLQAGSGMAGLAALSNFGMAVGVNGMHGISGYSIPISNSRPGSRRNSSDEGGNGGGNGDGGFAEGGSNGGGMGIGGWSQAGHDDQRANAHYLNGNPSNNPPQLPLSSFNRAQPIGPSYLQRPTYPHYQSQSSVPTTLHAPPMHLQTLNQQQHHQPHPQSQPQSQSQQQPQLQRRDSVSESDGDVDYDSDDRDGDGYDDPDGLGEDDSENPSPGSTSASANRVHAPGTNHNGQQSRAGRSASMTGVNTVAPSARNPGSQRKRPTSSRSGGPQPKSHTSSMGHPSSAGSIARNRKASTGMLELDGDHLLEGDGDGEGDEGDEDGEDDPDGGLDADGRPRKKQKLTRGSRACTVCRRLKMKCIEPDPEGGKPCKRCRNGNQECIFEESMRGKKSTRRKKLPDGSTPPPKAQKKPDQTSPAQSHINIPFNSISYLPESSRSGSAQSPMGPPSLPTIVKQEEMYFPSSAEKATLEKYHIRKPKSGVYGSQTLSKLLSEAPCLPDPPEPELNFGFQHDRSQHRFGSIPGGSGPSSSNGDLQNGFSVSSPAMDLANLVPRAPPSPRLDSLPNDSLNPLGLLAEASLQNSSRKRSMNMHTSPAESSRQALARSLSTHALAQIRQPSTGSGGVFETVAGSGLLQGSAVADDDEEQTVRPMGVGDEHYFKPGPMTIVPLRKVFIGKEVQPEMLTFVNNEEVQTLFDIYFDHLHVHVPVLDRVFHTPSTVCARSPFLMTVICAIASRFYTKRPDLQTRLSACANSLIFDVPMRGYKSVEVVQAYLLLTNFCLGPPERFEQDRTWLLLGLALRIATDLNLQRKMPFSGEDTDEGRSHDREVLNRERTWLVCFSSDRSYSAQMGKPYTIKEDFITRNCTSLAWQSHPLVMPSDVAVANYCTLQRIMSRALDTLYSNSSNPSGLLTDCDIPMIIEGFQTQLDSWSQSWLTQDSQPKRRQAQIAYNISGRFYYHYNSLVLNSFGLQNALIKSPTDTMLYFTKVYSAAVAVCEIALKETGPRGLLTYGSDAHFVMNSYAILSLLKLIRPEFRSLHNRQNAILDIVTRVVDAMADAAADPYHTPALYATLLKSFIASKAEEMKAEDANASTATAFSAVDPANLGSHGLSEENARKASMYPPANANGSLPANGFNDSFQFGVANGSTLGNWPNLTSTVSTPFNPHGPDMFSGMLPASPGSRVTQANTPFGGVSGGQGHSTGSSGFPPGYSMDDYGAALGMEEFGNWDSSFLMPGLGLGQPELSGGLIHGAWGSGFISPNFGMTPSQSVQPTPRGSPRMAAAQFPAQ